ncbi:MAG: hydroxyacylglutathione hydrolase [Bdellovibrionaceae bacterium]|nr:hydroxyacylglutathione hydrolase [Pseudobdellovibrionaceae bacterium]
MSLNVHSIPIFNDNYVFILQSEKDVALVDPGDFLSVNRAIIQLSLKPNFIFNTHHHWDHTDGNLSFKNAYDLKIYSSKYDMVRIPGVDIGLVDGQKIYFGDTFCEILFLPGHTLGHIAFYFPQESCLFSGDTLFSLGCGRLFEGTYIQMYQSLKRIQKLPPKTQIYCTHEYTQRNAAFACDVDSKNLQLKEYVSKVENLRKMDKPTIPTLLQTELECNPFLRCHSKDIQDYFQLTDCSEMDVFKQLRDLRNQY